MGSKSKGRHGKNNTLGGASGRRKFIVMQEAHSGVRHVVVDRYPGKSIKMLKGLKVVGEGHSNTGGSASK